MALPVNEKRKSLGSYRPSANRGTVCSGLTVGEVPPPWALVLTCPFLPPLQKSEYV